MIELFDEQGKSITLRQSEWFALREDAKAHGWTPAGTISDIPGWQGSYRLSEQQRFSDKDLRNFKESLQQVSTSAHIERFIFNADKLWIC